MDGDTNFRRTYRRATARRVAVIAACIVLCAVVAVLSILQGAYNITVPDVFRILWDALVNMPQEDATAAHVVLELRLPRILAAVLCGIAFAICGVAMQSILKNPLADPYTMGISSGAGFGAALAMILGVEILSGGGVVINAFLFAMVPTLIILFLSRFRRATPTMMILCGTSLMYLFNALTQLFMIIADPDDLSRVYQWMVGTLDDIGYGDLWFILAVTVAGVAAMQLLANRLNVIGAGDESARTLGVNVDVERLLILILITLVAATVVSFTGIIGFVGLVSPHIARLLVGSDNRFLLPASATIGALLLLVADLLSRTVSDLMLPVGVVTACIGGPLFMFLILRTGKEEWS
ncbi:MAG: iron ABC transporter permease [Thermoplasmata archaeon]|nr:iron ABC transporter permease [Thermoplasmata archaeon]